MSQVDPALATIPAYRMVFPAGDPASFEAYAGMLRPVFEAAIPRRARGRAFESQIDTFVLDAIFVTLGQTTALRLERSYATVVSGGIDEIMVVLYISGTHTLTVDGRTEAIGPGDVVIYDLTRTATIDMSDFETISLTIARRRLAEHFPAIDEAHGLVFRDGPLHVILREQLSNLPHLVAGLRQSDSNAVSAVLIALLTSCLQHVTGRRADTSVGTVSLSMVRDLIELHLAAPDFGPEWVMQHFGLSRATLYRMFEHLGGVASYITVRRMHQAFRLVATSSSEPPRISQLAFNLGYKSPTAFGRAFRKHFAMTPSQARAMVWRPRVGYDSPWQIPKITERFVRPLAPDGHESIQDFFSRKT